MYNVTVQKTVTDPSTLEEILYTYSISTETQESAMYAARAYASMVEYGIDSLRWKPTEGMPFPREQLYQFIQRSQLETIEAMYPDAVTTAYANALAYVQSYIGNMFDIEAMLDNNGTSASAMTLRLALCLSTVTFILASSPQYAETIELHNKQLHTLLRGLKSGSRSMGNDGIIQEPDTRIVVVNLRNAGSRP